MAMNCVKTMDGHSQRRVQIECRSRLKCPSPLTWALLDMEPSSLEQTTLLQSSAAAWENFITSKLRSVDLSQSGSPRSFRLPILIPMKRLAGKLRGIGGVGGLSGVGIPYSSTSSHSTPPPQAKPHHQNETPS